jgi:glycosyltransferase involved in cell wall biosynthesis
MSSVKIHRYFSDIWVPGIPQKKYAQKLGFKPNRIKTGFYAANTSIYLTRNTLKKRSQLRVYPRVLFYLGRYVEHKGIFDLWNAFDNYKSNGGKWELWCAGTGELWDKRPNIQGLKHLGFVQPTDIPSLTINVGAYILPSHKEPWGVAVQEMASAGLPLLLSTQIGSKDQFLAVGENGYEFPPEDHSSIENLLKKLDELNDLELLQMGQSSVDKADSIKQTDWVQTVLNWL